MTTTAVPGTRSAPELRAHLAVPSGPGPWPAVVVVHEVLGLTDDIRRSADRLAAAGYLAVAPDLLTGGRVRCLKAAFAALAAGHGAAFDDLDAVRRWVASRDDCTGRVGVLGFCMGGGFALVAATRGFDVSAPNYGPVPADAARVLAGACPVVASYGARDRPLRGAAARLTAALEQAGVENDVHEYADAGHSFLNRHPAPLLALERVVGMGWHEPSAAHAWERILRVFALHLQSRPPTGR